MIVTEFAAGHRDALRPLLTPETFAIFDGSINSREQAGETVTSEIRAIHEATIEAAQLAGTVADITVRFVSDQISQTLDRNGKYVSGADAVMELRDVWTFTRDLARLRPCLAPGPRRIGLTLMAFCLSRPSRERAGVRAFHARN